MPKSKQRSKRKRAPRSPEIPSWIPRPKHIGDPPEALLAEYTKVWRILATSNRHASSRRLLKKDPNSTAQRRDFVRNVALHMNNDIVQRHCPPWGLYTDFNRYGMIYCRWLRLEERPNPLGNHYGKIFYHPARPRLEINGGQYIPAFSRHMFDRLQERVFMRVQQDSPSAILVANLAKLAGAITHVEVKGNHGYWLYTRMPTFHRAAELYEHVAGITTPSIYMRRVAYVPVAFNGSFVVGKTALLPHMVKPWATDLPDRLFRFQWDSVEELEAMRAFHEKLPLFKLKTRSWFGD